jgi:opacity protein-like surface antigen
MTKTSAVRSAAVVLAIIGLAFAAPAWAQEGEQSQSGMQQPPPVDPDYRDVPYRFNISVGIGNLSGANPIGAVVDEDAGRVFTFEIDSGTAYNVRVAARIWWRLGLEAEYGYSSPGILRTTTNVQGADVQTGPFADYSMSWGAFSARLDLVDARVTPFLLGGAAIVAGSIDGESDVNPGFVFGGGLDFGVADQFAIRADIKGIRSNVDAPLLSRGILVQFEDAGNPLSTVYVWTIGGAFRF